MNPSENVQILVLEVHHWNNFSFLQFV